MLFKNTNEAYGLIAKCFHWITALIILGLLSVGFFMADADVSPQKFQLYFFHKSFGILVLMLVIARIGWRFYNHRKPHDLQTHQKWEKILAHMAHIALYLLIIAIPMTGWLMSSAGDFPAEFFGLFSLPKITPKNEDIFRFFRESHEILAYAILGIIALHAAGAFKHHFIDKDTTLKRMTYKRLGFFGGALLALIAGALIFSPLFIIYKTSLQDKAAQETTSQTAQTQSDNTALTSQAPSWNINTQASTINFTASQYGDTFNGAFKISSGRIFFDTEDMDDNQVSIDIDITSLSTGSEDRDAQAKSGDWFEIATYPAAHFTASDFEKTGNNQYIAHGTLDLHGIKKPLDLPFTLNMDGNQAAMQASISLKRLDFGIGSGQWAATDVIGDQVDLQISLQATRN